MVIEVLDGRGFCMGGIRELRGPRRLGVQELCGYVVSLGDQWFRVPSVRPIVHSIEGKCMGVCRSDQIWHCRYSYY